MLYFRDQDFIFLMKTTIVLFENALTVTMASIIFERRLLRHLKLAHLSSFLRRKILMASY